jgi:copper chaperone CopZ
MSPTIYPACAIAGWSTSVNRDALPITPLVMIGSQNCFFWQMNCSPMSHVVFMNVPAIVPQRRNLMANSQTLEIPISGMDCAECTQHVQQAIEKIPGVQSVNVFLATEKAIVQLDPDQVELPTFAPPFRARDIMFPHQPPSRLLPFRWAISTAD